MATVVNYVISFFDKNTDDRVNSYDVRADTINEALLDFISIDNRSNMSAYEHDLLLGIIESLKLDEKIDFCNLIIGDYNIISIRRITDETVYPKE